MIPKLFKASFMSLRFESNFNLQSERSIRANSKLIQHKFQCTFAQMANSFHTESKVNLRGIQGHSALNSYLIRTEGKVCRR